ncbi:MAG: dephospho-CoA kinase [Saonia sp.]
MIIVGLTGGIGSGKTTVGKMFADLGVPVYNSDIAAKKLMHSSKKVKNEIIKLLGVDAYTGKKLNKTYISDTVFRDAGLLKKLNSIVHPAVRTNFKTWAEEQDAAYVIQETAIIFENSSQKNYDKIILVTAPQEVRIQRVMDRDGISKEKIAARMNNQWDDTRKRELADFIIENIQIENTKVRVEDIHNQLLGLPN